MEIETDRLMLRPAAMSDLAAFHGVLSDPRATRYWSTLPHSDIEQTRDWLQSMVEAPAGESFDFVIEYEGRAVGKAGCWRLPEIGILLHPDVWGRGLAREALSALLPLIFDRFAIGEIVADVDPRNTACLALLTGLGFVETGREAHTYQLGEEWCDSVYLALKRPEG